MKYLRLDMLLNITTFQGLTIEQFVNEHKVILHGLLVELAEVALAQQDKPVEELEDQRGIGIALSHCDYVDVLVFDMAKGG